MRKRETESKMSASGRRHTLVFKVISLCPEDVDVLSEDVKLLADALEEVVETSLADLRLCAGPLCCCACWL